MKDSNLCEDFTYSKWHFKRGSATLPVKEDSIQIAKIFIKTQTILSMGLLFLCIVEMCVDSNNIAKLLYIYSTIHQ